MPGHYLLGGCRSLSLEQEVGVLTVLESTLIRLPQQAMGAKLRRGSTLSNPSLWCGCRTCLRNSVQDNEPRVRNHARLPKLPRFRISQSPAISRNRKNDIDRLVFLVSRPLLTVEHILQHAPQIWSAPLPKLQLHVASTPKVQGSKVGVASE